MENWLGPDADILNWRYRDTTIYFVGFFFVYPVQFQKYLYNMHDCNTSIYVVIESLSLCEGSFAAELFGSYLLFGPGSIAEGPRGCCSFLYINIYNHYRCITIFHTYTIKENIFFRNDFDFKFSSQFLIFIIHKSRNWWRRRGNSWRRIGGNWWKIYRYKIANNYNRIQYKPLLWGPIHGPIYILLHEWDVSSSPQIDRLIILYRRQCIVGTLLFSS